MQSTCATNSDAGAFEKGLSCWVPCPAASIHEKQITGPWLLEKIALILVSNHMNEFRPVLEITKTQRQGLKA